MAQWSCDLHSHVKRLALLGHGSCVVAVKQVLYRWKLRYTVNSISFFSAALCGICAYVLFYIFSTIAVYSGD